MYLLDTNIVSELRKVKAGKADKNVKKWAAKVDASELFISNPRPVRDALIAATALVHGMQVVTRHTDDFCIPNLSVLNPWKSH
jgi:predicted nucleic acid-binding protein